MAIARASDSAWPAPCAVRPRRSAVPSTSSTRHRSIGMARSSAMHLQRRPELDGVLDTPRRGGRASALGRRGAARLGRPACARPARRPVAARCRRRRPGHAHQRLDELVAERQRPEVAHAQLLGRVPRALEVLDRRPPTGPRPTRRCRVRCCAPTCSSGQVLTGHLDRRQHRGGLVVASRDGQDAGQAGRRHRCRVAGELGGVHRPPDLPLGGDEVAAVGGQVGPQVVELALDEHVAEAAGDPLEVVDGRDRGVDVMAPDEHLDGHPARAQVVRRVGVGHRQLPGRQRIGRQPEHEAAVLGDDRRDLGAAPVAGGGQLGLSGLGVVERGLRGRRSARCAPGPGQERTEERLALRQLEQVA